jgi:hypothetical protein
MRVVACVVVRNQSSAASLHQRRYGYGRRADLLILPAAGRIAGPLPAFARRRRNRGPKSHHRGQRYRETATRETSLAGGISFYRMFQPYRFHVFAIILFFYSYMGMHINIFCKNYLDNNEIRLGDGPWMLHIPEASNVNDKLLSSLGVSMPKALIKNEAKAGMRNKLAQRRISSKKS